MNELTQTIEKLENISVYGKDEKKRKEIGDQINMIRLLWAMEHIK